MKRFANLKERSAYDAISTQALKKLKQWLLKEIILFHNVQLHVYNINIMMLIDLHKKENLQ